MKRYARDYDPSTVVIPLCEATRREQLLIDAIGEMAVATGLYSHPNISPALALAACMDTTSYITQLHKKIDEAHSIAMSIP